MFHDVEYYLQSRGLSTPLSSRLQCYEAPQFAADISLIFPFPDPILFAPIKLGVWRKLKT